MNWKTVERIKALIGALEDGGPVTTDEAKEALLILLRDAVDRFYGNLD